MNHSKLKEFIEELRSLETHEDAETFIKNYESDDLYNTMKSVSEYLGNEERRRILNLFEGRF